MYSLHVLKSRGVPELDCYRHCGFLCSNRAYRVLWIPAGRNILLQPFQGGKELVIIYT